MSKVVLSIENVSKQYRLGTIGTGTISHDLNRWWHAVRGKDDPYAKIGTVNNRDTKDEEEYVWALKDINLEINDGDVVGIIGKNGAGKSTLLKLLSQVTNPTTGNIKVRGRIASLLEVGTGFHPELTGRENIYLNGAILGMSKAEIASKFDEIVEFAGVARYIETPVKRYSSGMMVRLGFAVAAHLEPEILVVDEVLAVGDAEFQNKCIGKMKDVSEQGRTVLFVSHNMTSIKNLCDRGIVLTNGSVTFDGQVDEAIHNYLMNNKIEDIENSYLLKDELSQGCMVKSITPFKNKFEYSEKIVFDIRFTYKMELNNTYFGFIIEDKHSNTVIAGSTDETENNLLRFVRVGDIQIQIQIPEMILKPGVYSFSFSLRDTGGQVFHKVVEAFSFKVADTKTFRGIKGRYRKNAVVAPKVNYDLVRG